MKQIIVLCLLLVGLSSKIVNFSESHKETLDDYFAKSKGRERGRGRENGRGNGRGSGIGHRD